MDVSPALVVDRVLQMRNSQAVQGAQIGVLKQALDLQEAGAAALLQGPTGDLTLARAGQPGSRVNTLA
jgi:hypothetical protein